MRCEHLLGPGQRLRVRVCGLGVRGEVISAVLALHAETRRHMGPSATPWILVWRRKQGKKGKSLTNYNLTKFISRLAEFSKLVLNLYVLVYLIASIKI